VTTRHEAGLRSATDPEQLAYANAEGRMIFTEDGVYCKQNSRSIGEILAGQELIWELWEPEEMRNRVEFI
jgi:predicted nuclease of predicted toxin-antitoxin system